MYMGGLLCGLGMSFDGSHGQKLQGSHVTARQSVGVAGKLDVLKMDYSVSITAGPCIEYSVSITAAVCTV